MWLLGWAVCDWVSWLDLDEVCWLVNWFCLKTCQPNTKGGLVSPSFSRWVAGGVFCSCTFMQLGIQCFCWCLAKRTQKNTRRGERGAEDLHFCFWLESRRNFPSLRKCMRLFFLSRIFKRMDHGPKLALFLDSNVPFFCGYAIVTHLLEHKQMHHTKPFIHQ